MPDVSAINALFKGFTEKERERERRPVQHVQKAG